jgi:hypothetical protein
MNYRRAHVEGGTYFFTVNLAQREGRLLVDHIDILRNAVRYVKMQHPFHIDAFSMPLWCYRTTSTRYGPCRRATTTTPRDGCLSKQTFPVAWCEVNVSAEAG